MFISDFSDLKISRQDLYDDENTGSPEGNDRSELVEKVYEITAVDKNFTVRMLSKE